MDQLYEAQFVENVNHYQNNETGNKCINEYELIETIGFGSFGKVKRVTRSYVEEEGGEVKKADYAMKIFNRTVLQNQRYCFYEDDGKVPRITNMLEFAYSEINIWKYLDHPNVCKLYEIIDDSEDPKDCVYIVTQLGNLGPVMEYNFENFKRNKKVYEYIAQTFEINNLESIAAKIFKQVAQGIQYLHEQLIVNRDVKVDNIVVSSNYEKEQCVKLIDFSTARYIKDQKSILYDCAGTLGFRSPEQQFSLEEGYMALPCDIWSFGICLYTYINEKMPFWAESELEIDLIARKQSIEYMEHNSLEVQDLINKCCDKNPLHRPTIQVILKHPFFNK